VIDSLAERPLAAILRSLARPPVRV
jgi:hypothetical protein